MTPEEKQRAVSMYRDAKSNGNEAKALKIRTLLESSAAPAANEQPAQETPLVDKAVEVGRAPPRGLAKAVDFFTGALQGVDKSQLTAGEQEDFRTMTPIVREGEKPTFSYWSGRQQGGLPQERYIPKIMDSPLAQSLMGPRVERGLEGNEGMDALTFGGEWVGGSALGGAKALASLPNAVSTVAATGGDYISNLLTEGDKGTTTGTVAGLLPMLYSPVKGFKNYLKSRADKHVTSNPMDVIEAYSDNPKLVMTRLRQAAEAGDDGKTLSQLVPEDTGIAQLEKRFRDSGTAEGKQAFKQSDIELSQAPQRQADTLTDATANVEDIRKTSQDRVANISGGLGQREGRVLSNTLDQQRQSVQNIERTAGSQQEDVASVLKQAVGEQDTMLAKTVAAEDEAAQRAAMFSERSIQDVTSKTPTAETSASMLSATDEAADVAKVRENELWAQVPDQAIIPTDTVKKRLKSSISELYESETKLGKIYEDEIFKYLDGAMGGRLAISPQELGKVRSEISGKLRALDRVTDPSAAKTKFYQKLNNNLLDLLDSSGTGEAYRTASKATRERYELFERSNIGKQRGKADTYTFGEKAIKGGNEGLSDYDTIEKIGGALPQAAKSNLTAQFSEASKKGGSGFNVSGSQSFLDKNKPVLQRAGLYDGMKKAVNEARLAEDTISQASKLKASVAKQTEQAKAVATQQASTTEKAIESSRSRQVLEAESRQAKQAKELRSNYKKAEKYLETTPTQKVAASEIDKIDNSVGKILDSESSIKDLTQLKKTAKKDKTGRANAALKRSVMNHVVSSMMGKDGLIKSDAVETLTKYRRSMVDSKLFTENDIAKLAGSIDDAKLALKTKGINPADIPDPIKGLAYYSMSFIGARVGRGLMKGTLQGPELGRQLAVDKLHKIPHANALKATEAIMLNPSKYKSKLNKAKTDDELIKLINDIAVRYSSTKAVQEDDK